MNVYLAGPITGLTYAGAVDWRDAAAAQLDDHGIVGWSPMRAKLYLQREGRIADSYEETTLSRAKAITVRDRWDCQRSDIVLANLVGAERVSIGTVLELGWADAARVPIVLAMEEGNIHEHSMVNEVAGFRVPTLEEALDVIISIAKPW